jgi:hypothetical protein
LPYQDNYFPLLQVIQRLCPFPQELCAAVAAGALPHLPAAVDALGAEPPGLLAPCAAASPRYHDRTARLVLEQVERLARAAGALGAGAGAAPDGARVGRGPGHAFPLCALCCEVFRAGVLVRAVLEDVASPRSSVFRIPVVGRGALT